MMKIRRKGRQLRKRPKVVQIVKLGKNIEIIMINEISK